MLPGFLVFPFVSSWSVSFFHGFTVLQSTQSPVLSAGRPAINQVRQWKTLSIPVTNPVFKHGRPPDERAVRNLDAGWAETRDGLPKVDQQRHVDVTADPRTRVVSTCDCRSRTPGICGQREDESLLYRGKVPKITDFGST
jgi:hypothetical protein